MFFCSCSSYLQQITSCSNLQESGLPHELWNQNKCVFAAVRPTCSTQQPCAARNKLQWAARSSIVLWTLKSEKRIFAAFQATSSSKQPCAACNKLQRAAGLGREIWNRKNVFLHPFKLPAAHKSLVQPPTSYSELQEAGLLHEHGYWKNDFFGSCSSYCSSQQPCAAGNKLQWAAGSWIGSWALKWEKCSLPAVLSICSSQQPWAATDKLQLQDAGLRHEHGNWKNHFFLQPFKLLQLTTAFCRQQQGTVICRKLDCLMSIEIEKM